MSRDDIKYWIGFSKIYSIGPASFAKIRRYFPTLELAWKASITDLGQAGLSDGAIAELIRVRQELNLNQEIETLARERVSVVTIDDEEYPALLKEIHLPPPLLYYRGTLPAHESYTVAMVGSRKYSPYGEQMAALLARDLASQGITVVSGLALGIDAIAHEAALSAQGITIGVLGTGVDARSIYPAANHYLANRILEKGGAIISEFPPGTPGLSHHFPRRNRVIAGLTLGTVVVEAAEKSGALITARYALEENREVFAVPGNATSASSVGTNGLIKMGARAVTEASDILDALNLASATDYMKAQEIMPDTAEEAALLNHLTREPVHVDILARLTQMPITTINATLTLMEMKGKIRHLGGMQYVRSR